MGNGHDATDLVLDDFDRQVDANDHHIERLKNAPYVPLSGQNTCPDHLALAKNIVLVKEGQGISLSGMSLIIRALKQVYVRNGVKKTADEISEKSEAKFWGIDIKGPFVRYIAIPVGAALFLLILFAGQAYISRGMIADKSDALQVKGQVSNAYDNRYVITKIESTNKKLDAVIEALNKQPKGNGP